MALRFLFQNNFEIKLWKKRMEESKSYEEWLEAANNLDKLCGFDKWKNDPISNDYDYELIQTRLEQFRVAREIGDLESISFLLRASMSRGLGDIGKMELYSQSYAGTKKLIEEYTEEVTKSLEFMYERLPEDNRVARRNKYEFFRGLRHMLGNTAMVLSGGGSLGTHHIGVLHALLELGLLPRIVSGSSAGGIMAALLCTRLDGELEGLMMMDELNLNFLNEPGASAGWQQLWIKVRRWMREGVVFDQGVLRTCLRENIGPVTFLEAYRRTGRILNITVSSSTRHEQPQMLNYLTAPNVLIWSAVLASCAVPGIFVSHGLLARDPRSGALIPWHPSDEARWIDGSVENDVPRARLGEIFNVNHFIVSQVNPHIFPFLDGNKPSEPGPPSRLRTLLRTALYLLHSEVCFRLQQLQSLGLFFPDALHRLLSVLKQKYGGDITIIPVSSLTDIRLSLVNPSREQIVNSVNRGIHATWPLIPVIWNQCRAEILLDKLLSRMKRKSWSKKKNKLLASGSRLKKIKSQSELFSSASSIISSSSSSSSSSNSNSITNTSNNNNTNSNSNPTSPRFSAAASRFHRSSSPLAYRDFEASLSQDF